MPRHGFYLDGTSSRDYGIYVSGTGVYNAPERDVEIIEIPGRNGTLTIDNGRYRNIEVSYPAIFVQGFKENIESARAWLCGTSAYRRLEDDYNIDSYRMARYTDGLNLNVATMLDAAKCTLRFDCMPQRFLYSGEKEVAMTNGGKIINPTSFDALPLIKVVGAGTLTINGANIVITAASVTLDSEIQRAYLGTTPLDSTITGEFPVLTPGENTVSWTGSTSVKITPRWWTL